MKIIKARIESAIVDDKAEGIYIIYTDVTDKKPDCVSKKEEQSGLFVPRETWGKIPSTSNPRFELQKIADLLNGIKKENNTISQIENWKPRIINIEINQ